MRCPSVVCFLPSMTPVRVSVFELAQRFGEDSAVGFVGVICFLSSATPGSTSVVEWVQRFGEDSR